MINDSTFEQLKELAKANKKNSIILKTKPEPVHDLGLSKIGGRPDLPKDIEWPKWEGRSLSFIAQINCAEINKYDVSNLLPSTGILYFFYNQSQRTWGFDPNDKGSWAVIYCVEIADLARKPFPSDLENESTFKECSLEISQRDSYPEIESFVFKAIKNAYRYFDEYFDWRKNKEDEESGTINKLLGHPNQIQGEMQKECQLVSNGLYCGDASGYKDPRAESLRNGAVDWLLLLQIDSDDNAGMMWGDVGRLYYWIKKEDLQQKCFENTWMILQCG